VAALAGVVRELGAVLGLLQQVPGEYLKRGVGAATLSDADIEGLLDSRRAARKSKNFSESDRIRDLLTAAGIVLEDKAGGTTTWRRA
jgi:cysteinyl-tRNA synthetase